MDANERKEYAAGKLADVRAGILENAGKGEEAVSAILPPEVEAYRMLLKARLASERGRTYTYRDPANIPTGEIKVNMGAVGHILSRPGGWGDTKEGKKEKKKNKKKGAALPGNLSGQSSQYSGQQQGDGTSGYRSGGNSGGTAGGYGLAGTQGGTRITGTGSGGFSPIGKGGGGGGWFAKLWERLTDDD